MTQGITHERRPARWTACWLGSLTGALLLSAGAVQGFPESALAMASEDLRGRLADKVFDVRPASGPPWRMEFKANGYFFVNVGNYRDDGSWNAKDSALCMKGKQMRDGCNEVRLVGADLVLRRDSGELVKLEPR